MRLDLLNYTRVESIAESREERYRLLRDALHFARRARSVPHLEQVLAGLYPGADDGDQAVHQGFELWREGQREEEALHKVWSTGSSMGIDDEMRMVRYLNRYPNYALGSLADWSVLPRDMLVRRQRVESLMGNRTGAILDIGCSINPWLDLYKGRGPFVGLDLSAPALKIGAIRDPANRGRMVWGHAEGLPFNDCSFDIIVMSEVLEHLSHPALAIKEMARVMAPGAIALVTVPIHMVDTRGHAPKGGDPTHRGSFYSYEELCQEFRQAGLTIDKVMRDPYYIFKLSKMA
ncbi:MAG: methyltransferase domain-containing protein [Chloroflexi bacterium]|nr:methyltransferase domain-containing protein [Chloroflexota bacterium]